MWRWSDVWWWVVVGPILKIFICPNLHSRREPGLVLRGAKIPLGRSSWSYFLPLPIPLLTAAQWHKCGICPHCLSCGSFQLKTWKYWSLKWWKRFEKFPVYFLLVSCFDKWFYQKTYFLTYSKTKSSSLTIPQSTKKVEEQNSRIAKVSIFL